MADPASTFLQQLYELGARRIGVFSAPPIGFDPSQGVLAGFRIDRVQSHKSHNRAALLFDSKLSKRLDFLSSRLPMDFEVAARGCCGTGKLEVAILCNPRSGTCPNVSNHVFWDSYHPSKKAYRALVPPILQQHVNKFF